MRAPARRSLDVGAAVPPVALPFTDRILVLPDLLVDPSEVDVVDAAAGPDPHSGLAHGRQGVFGVNVAVVDEGGAEQQRFERAEPAQRHRFVRGDVMAMRDPRRVGRSEPHVLGDTANHGQDRVSVDVDEPGRHDAAAGVEMPASRKVQGG